MRLGYPITTDDAVGFAENVERSTAYGGMNYASGLLKGIGAGAAGRYANIYRSHAFDVGTGTVGAGEGARNLRRGWLQPRGAAQNVGYYTTMPATAAIGMAARPALGLSISAMPYLGGLAAGTAVGVAGGAVGIAGTALGVAGAGARALAWRATPAGMVMRGAGLATAFSVGRGVTQALMEGYFPVEDKRKYVDREFQDSMYGMTQALDNIARGGRERMRTAQGMI
jgi:hypothetical protein